MLLADSGSALGRAETPVLLAVEAERKDTLSLEESAAAPCLGRLMPTDRLLGAVGVMKPDVALTLRI